MHHLPDHIGRPVTYQTHKVDNLKKYAELLTDLIAKHGSITLVQVTGLDRGEETGYEILVEVPGEDPGHYPEAKLKEESHGEERR